MSALHSALKCLGPTAFADVPSGQSDLESYLSDLFTECQLILDSIPIADPTSSDQSSIQPVVARSAAEVKPSAARSAPPSNKHALLPKEWGKPVKLSAKDNPLGMSVYKTSGKDGRGAWFARHSVHEGVGFAKFKKSLQQEFEESLAVHGPPGEGNIRGIGGEERVESIDILGKGKIEVFRLSAQFPGPTTPRDFVTLLITSDNAIKPFSEQQTRVPRHYMMISKPCDHPQTQPQSSFIRGSYESVEFIREIPRKLKTSLSTTDLGEPGHKDTTDLGKEAVVWISQGRLKASDSKDQEAGVLSNPAAKTRGRTAPDSPTAGVRKGDEEDEQNPVEWIMVTRSDPGGSVPRFMVERGTPASICADASKFLDWACQSDDEEEEKDQLGSNLNIPKHPQARRDSFQSFRSSRFAGLEANDRPDQSEPTQETKIDRGDTGENMTSGGFVGAVVGAVTAYTPQVVLDHLPGGTISSVDDSSKRIKVPPEEADEDDTKSIQSATSFRSAEDRLLSDDEGNISEVLSGNGSNSSVEKAEGKVKHTSHHEKELAKLEERRAALETKFAASRSKLDNQATEQTQRDEQAHQKAMERHDKEFKKHEEKYQKELKKLEERQKKERKKLEEKQHKQEHKNDILRISRERDDAKKEAELARKEAEMLKGIIVDLQKQNTALVAKLGKMGGDIKAEIDSSHSTEAHKSAISDHLRSQSSSSSLKKLVTSHHH